MRGSSSLPPQTLSDATLDSGSILYVRANGGYGPRSTYTILKAGGTLSGTFGGANADYVFMTPNLRYDYGAGLVSLELSRNKTAFTSVALTDNQTAAANGIDSIGIAAVHPVYESIVQMPDNGDLIRAGFDSLSGEIHASGQSVLIQDSRFIRNAANDRVRAAFGAVGTSIGAAYAYDSRAVPVAVSVNHAGPVFWSQAFGSWASAVGDGNAAGVDHSTNGLLFGADRSVGNWRIGVLGAYSHSKFDVNE